MCGCRLIFDATSRKAHLLGYQCVSMSSGLSKTNLVIQNDQIQDISLGTLAARTALALGSQFNGITATFLMKRVKYWLQLEEVTEDQGPFLVGIASGDAGAAEISSAMTERNTAGPADTTQVLTQDNAFVVVQNSVRMMKLHRNGTDAAPDTWTLEGEVSLGKGIPFREGSGWQPFILNADNAALATTAPVCKGIIQYWGVWLRD